jgi:hypothetical protein
MKRIDSLIGIWSTRPQPGTPMGDVWEAGARQGWQWAIEEAAKIAVEQGDVLEIHGPRIAKRIRDVAT